jgi:hypothetical protein
MSTSETIWDADAARARCRRSVDACERFFAGRKRPENANGQAFFDLCLAEFEVRRHLLATDCFSSREAVIAELRRLLAEPVVPSSILPCRADQYLAYQKQDIEVEIHNLTLG